MNVAVVQILIMRWYISIFTFNLQTCIYKCLLCIYNHNFIVYTPVTKSSKHTLAWCLRPVTLTLFLQNPSGGSFWTATTRLATRKVKTNVRAGEHLPNYFFLNSQLRFLCWFAYQTHMFFDFILPCCSRKSWLFIAFLLNWLSSMKTESSKLPWMKHDYDWKEGTDYIMQYHATCYRTYFFISYHTM